MKARIFMVEEEEGGTPRRIVATGAILKSAGGPAVGALTVEKGFARDSIALSPGRDFPRTWFPFRTPDGPVN